MFKKGNQIFHPWLRKKIKFDFSNLKKPPSPLSQQNLQNING